MSEGDTMRETEPVERSINIIYVVLGTIAALVVLAIFVIDDTQADTARETTQDQQIVALQKAETQNDKEHSNIATALDKLSTKFETLNTSLNKFMIEQAKKNR